MCEKETLGAPFFSGSSSHLLYLSIKSKTNLFCKKMRGVSLILTLPLVTYERKIIARNCITKILPVAVKYAADFSCFQMG